MRAPCQVRPTRVNLAILTYNALAHTQKCLASILRHTQGEYNIFVVDNASTDGSREWWEAQQIPNLHLHFSEVNLGVPGGRNQLFKMILPQLPEDGVIAFLDNDVLVQPGYVQDFLQAFDAHPQAGVVGKTGHPIELRGDCRHLLLGPEELAPVDVVSGFSFWVRGSTARDVGGFDEGLGLFWHEDDDFCVRALAKGYEVFAHPQAGIVHDEHQSGAAIGQAADEDSLHKQAYLAQKWRQAGYVDSQGWIIRPRSRFYLSPQQCVDLQQQLGRKCSLTRYEVSRVLWDLGGAAEQPELIYDLHLAVIELLAPLARQSSDHAFEQRLGKLQALYQEQGFESPSLAHTSPKHASRFYQVADWEDADWWQSAQEVLGDAAEQDVYRRQRSAWEQVQLYHALELQPEMVVLAMGSWNDALPHALARQVKLVVAVDCMERNPEEPEPLTEMPANMKALRLSAMSLQLPDNCFDVVTAFSLLHLCAGQVGMARALREMARVTKPGGVVAISTDVLTNDVLDGQFYRPQDFVDALLSLSGLQLLQPLHMEDVPASVQAFLQMDDRRLASATFFLRKPLAFELPIGWQLPSLTPNRAPLCKEAVLPGRQSLPPMSATIPKRIGPQRIGVDVRNLYYANSTSRGIGHYTIYHLEALFDLLPESQFILYGELDLPDALSKFAASARVQFRSVDAYQADDVDIMHIPGQMDLNVGFDSPLRILRHPRSTVTFHDLIPLRYYWHEMDREARRIYLSRLRQLQAFGGRILCNSEFTRMDLLASLKLPVDKVRTVMAGLNSDSLAKTPADPEMRQRLGLHPRNPFFLVVGALDPHKNFASTLSAFLQLARPDLQLVVVGKMGFREHRYQQYCAQQGIGNVLFTDFVSRSDLEALYSEALALLFLSFYEGFGFPVLEAMARGCPVLCSNVSSIPEVAGTAAVQVSPDNEAEIIHAMTALLQDSALRQEMQQKGLQQAANYTWQATAHKTLQVWQEMLAEQVAQQPLRPVLQD